jgi:hypothetical protein
MTTDAVPAAIVPPHPAWRSLLWTIPFTVLWTWLIYSLPVLLESGLPALTVRLMVHGLIALGLWLGLKRTDLTPNQRRTTWLAIMVPFTLWAAVAWTAAINGVLRTSASPLPLLPLAIFVPVIIGAPLLLLRSMRCRRHGSSLFSFTASSAANGSLTGCLGCCPAHGRYRQELVMC